MRHSLRETWSGLRRNFAMTIAVIVTMSVSLTLLGAGLLIAMEADLAKKGLYEKVEVTAYFCTADSRGGQCETGKEATDAQRAQVEETLRANPQVDNVVYVSKDEVFAEFQRTYEGTAVEGSRTVEDMQDSVRIQLHNPENYAGVVSEAKAMPGVHKVQDLTSVLEPMFRWLRALQWATIALSGLLLLAGALQIANTIRMAAFARRREIGIMRLVGASSIYILLPFLLESLFAAAIGILLAGGALTATYWFVIVENAKPSLGALDWIGWSELITAILSVAGVGLALAIVPTLLATRKYLRI